MLLNPSGFISSTKQTNENKCPKCCPYVLHLSQVSMYYLCLIENQICCNYITILHKSEKKTYGHACVTKSVYSRNKHFLSYEMLYR